MKNNKSLFDLILLSMIALFFSCGGDNPAAPDTTDPLQKIQVTAVTTDTISSAMLVLAANLTSDSNGLVSFAITNNNTTSYTFNISLSITGYSSVARKTLTVAANSSRTIDLTPLMLSSVFKTLTEIKTVQYDIAVTCEVAGQTKTVYQETPTALLTARDVIDWQYSFMIVGWVTPHVGAVDTLIRIAAAYHPDNSLVGYQGTPDPQTGTIAALQVAAIYDALQAQGITYINSPASYPLGTQRVKYPADAIGLASANCIDGTVLFAAALENIGLNPKIVLIPGHAFLAWETWDGSGIVDCLETTMLNFSTFDEAHTRGLEEYNAELTANHFTDGSSLMIDIDTWRAAGFTPLMKRAIN